MPALTKQEISACFKAARRVLRHPGLDILINPVINAPSLRLSGSGAQERTILDSASYGGPSQAPGKILVVTAARVGNAPERNLIRRRLKAIFHEENLGARGYNCIVLVKKAGITLSFDELKQLLMQAIPHDSVS